METAPLLHQASFNGNTMHQLDRTVERGRYWRLGESRETELSESRGHDSSTTAATFSGYGPERKQTMKRTPESEPIRGFHEQAHLVRNPFARRDRSPNLVSYVRLTLGVLLFLPVRLLLSVGTLLLAWLLIFLATLGVSRASLGTRPLPRWRRRLVFGVLRLFSRFLLFVFGFWHLCEYGDLGSRHDLSGSCIIVSNHVSFFDILYFIYAFAPAFVAKREVLSLPFVGTIAAAMQSIFVDRERTQTGGTAELIRKRVTSVDAAAYPPLVLFPEGTTSNGDALLKFHSGAFLSGVCVRPLALRYESADFDPAFVGLTPWRLAGILSQPWMSMTVYHLPIYEPSPVERERPRLYAEHVRALIARALQIECVELNYRDRVRRNLSRIGLHMVEVSPKDGGEKGSNTDAIPEDDALRNALV
jgi:lysophosphatidylcholine acyltransferase/lyso-PAF acetyltransferase